MDDSVLDDIKNYVPTRNRILFRFIQDIGDGTFTNKTSWGLQIRNKIEDVKMSRWGIVEKVGPEVSDRITPGMYILIEPLMWTEGFKVNEVKYWITSQDKLFATSEEEPTGLI